MTDEPKPFPDLVRDLMTVGVSTCLPGTAVVDIARLLLEKNLEAVVVLDGEEGHALGVVGRDELAAAFARPDARTLTAEQAMRDNVPQCPPDIPLAAAAQLMRDQHTRALFMMHHAGGVVYPAGVITYDHLLRHLAARSAEDLADLGINAKRQSPIDIFLQRRDEARRKNLGRP